MSKVVKTYTDEEIAEIGTTIVALRKLEAEVKRRLRSAEQRQEEYIATIRTKEVVHEPSVMQKQHIAFFAETLQRNDPGLLLTVYNVCLASGANLMTWKSEYGEVMDVAFRRRMTELGNATIEDISSPTMSIIACGDRNWPIERIDTIRETFAKLPITTQLIHGGNGYYDKDDNLVRGADMICDQVARELGWPEPKCFPFKTQFGRAGGPIRNTEMLMELLARRNRFDHDIRVIAFHPDIDSSKGTKNMVEQAAKKGVAYEVVQ